MHREIRQRTESIIPSGADRTIAQSGDFNPFEFNALLRPLEKAKTTRLVPVLALLVAALIVATISEGTFGSWRDLQLVDDARRLVGGAGVSAAEPSFPFVRDVPSWLLLFTIVAGGLALHRQCVYFSRCLSTLAKNGALLRVRERRDLLTGRNLGSKLLGIDNILATQEPQDALRATVERVMRPARRLAWLLSTLSVLVAFGLAALLVTAERNRVFQPLVPAGLSPAERDAWLTAAYQSWWGSDAHLAGHVAYWVMAFIALFIVVSYHTSGALAIYLLLCLPYVTRGGADWANRDRRYGWEPLARLYRTVAFATALLGIALTVLLLVMGLSNAPWLSPLLLLYAVAAPTFVLLPRIVFGRARERAVRDRIEDITQAMRRQELDANRDLDRVDRLAPFLAEIDRCDRAEIHPLRLRRFSISTLGIVYVLPVVLGIVQLAYPTGTLES